MSRITIKHKNNNFLNSLKKITEKTDELKQMQIELENMYADLDYHVKEIHLITKKWIEGQTEHENETTQEREELGHSQSELQQQLQKVSKIQSELQLKQDEQRSHNDPKQHNMDVSSLKKQVDEINNEMEEEEQIFNTFEESLNEIKTQLNTNPVQMLKTNKLVDLLQSKLQQKQEQLLYCTMQIS